MHSMSHGVLKSIEYWYVQKDLNVHFFFVAS